MTVRTSRNVSALRVAWNEGDLPGLKATGRAQVIVIKQSPEETVLLLISPTESLISTYAIQTKVKNGIKDYLVARNFVGVKSQTTPLDEVSEIGLYGRTEAASVERLGNQDLLDMIEAKGFKGWKPEMVCYKLTFRGMAPYIAQPHRAQVKPTRTAAEKPVAVNNKDALKQAIATVNDFKTQMGDDVSLHVKSDGTLGATIMIEL